MYELVLKMNVENMHGEKIKTLNSCSKENAVFPLENSFFYGIGKIIAIYFESKAKYVFTYMQINCGKKCSVFEC